MRVAAGLLAVGLLAAACSSSTTTTVGATTTTTAAPPSSPATSSTITTTDAPESTTTTVAAEAGVTVVGDEAFTAQADAALALLEAEAADGYAQVVLYIDTIESVSAGSGMDVFTKTFLVGDETAFAPGFAEEDQIVWLASTIVHDSCHSRLYAEGAEYSGRDAELACMQDQLGALEAIDNDYFEGYVQSLIDGVDDPDNAYWTDPNRHW